MSEFLEPVFDKGIHVFADGKDMVIINNAKMGGLLPVDATVLKGAIVSGYSISVNNNLSPMASIGSPDIDYFDMGGKQYTVNLSINPQAIEELHGEDGNAMLKAGLFKNLSVGDLFAIINAKLKAREEGLE